MEATTSVAEAKVLARVPDRNEFGDHRVPP